MYKNKSVVIELRMFTLGVTVTGKEQKGGSSDAGNVLCLDLNDRYTGVYICKNSLSCSLMICTFS